MDEFVDKSVAPGYEKKFRIICVCGFWAGRLICRFFCEDANKRSLIVNTNNCYFEHDGATSHTKHTKHWAISVCFQVD